MDAEKLIQQIESAFEGVLLEEGIGINEADRIETEERDVLIQKGRNLDRLWWKSWHEIEDKYIASYPSAMDFMDSQGLKWVLPAYLIYSIRHYKKGSFSVDSTLYTLEAGALGRDGIDLYSVEQKRVIAHFLEYMVGVGDRWVDVGAASRALQHCWGRYLKECQ